MVFLKETSRDSKGRVPRGGVRILPRGIPPPLLQISDLPSTGKGAEKPEALLCCKWGCKTVQSVKWSPRDSAVLAWAHTQKNGEQLFTHTHLCTDAHSHNAHSGQKVDNNPAAHQPMKENAACPLSGIGSALKGMK